MNTQWPRVSLGELLRLERRPVKVEADKQYEEIGIYCFGRGIFRKLARSGLEVGDKNLFQLKDGDFILQVTFAWEGAIAVVSAAEDGLYGSTRYPTFRVDEDRCTPQFLLNYFKTHEGVEQLVRICPGSAGRNRVLSIKRIPEVFVPLPPLAEQRRVVARIDQLVALVNEARTLRQQAAEEAAALSHSFLSSLLRAEEANARWPMRSLGMIAEINPRRSQKTIGQDSKVTFVPMRAVSDETGRIVASELRTYSEVKTGYTRFEDGDVIFARITPCMENGKSAVAEDLENGIGFGSTEFHVVRPGAEVESSWLHHLFRHREFINSAAEHFTGTAGQQRVPVSFMREKTVLVPPLPEQRRIVAELDELQVEVDALKRLQAETAAELDAMVPSILDCAFSGQLFSSDLAECRESATAIDAQSRPTFSAEDYFVQLIPALLRATGGSLALNKLNEAVALLFLPKVLNPLIDSVWGKDARAHFDRFNQPLNDSALVPMLQVLLKTGAVTCKANDQGTSLHLHESGAPPTKPVVEEDARFLAAIVNLIPSSPVQATVNKLCPQSAQEELLITS